MTAPRPDVERLLRAHRRAFWDQWSEVDWLIWGGVVLVLGTPLVALGISVVIWGWM